MIGLSHSQLEIILCTAEPLAEEKCQEFLERVAAVLQGRDQIDDDDVSTAVQVALRALIHNSAVWKDWKRNSLQMREGPPPALNRRRAWRWLPALSTLLSFFAIGLSALGLLSWRRKRTQLTSA